MENFTSATISKENEDQENDWDGKNWDTCFHIFSQTARQLKDLANNTEYQDDGTVLFGAGTEFLVCKKEQIDGKTHIYIREV